MNIVHDYIEEHKLLLIKWTGQWNLEEYKKAINILIRNIKAIDVQKIIQDITDLDLDISFNDLSQLVKIRKEIIKQDFKVVYITSKPKDIVFHHFHSKELKNKNLYMYCTTTEKALDLLLIRMSDFELKNRFSMLKKIVTNQCAVNLQ